MAPDKGGRVALVCHTVSDAVDMTFFDGATAALEAAWRRCGPKCVQRHTIAVYISGQIRTRSIDPKTMSGKSDDIRAAFLGNRDAARRLLDTLET